MKPMLRVAVTGGAGQIAYNLLFQLASGAVFGLDTPLALHILDIEPMMDLLRGVCMELEDGAFPVLREVVIGSDPYKVFAGIDWALLIGAKPRLPGMERADLLKENSAIFALQGQALGLVAKPTVKVLVVGNPCNTNCLITYQNASCLPSSNFHALTRLDQNRTTALLAKKMEVDPGRVRGAIIWGNHSATQVPDITYVTVDRKPIDIQKFSSDWLYKDFVRTIQTRGAEVLKVRGKSSAASASYAIADAIRSLAFPTPVGQWYSSGMLSDGNPYGVASELIFSFPCYTAPDGSCRIYEGLPWAKPLQEHIDKTQRELQEERQSLLAIL